MLLSTKVWILGYSVLLPTILSMRITRKIRIDDRSPDMSLNEQCKILGYDGACDVAPGSDFCGALFCGKKEKNDTVPFHTSYAVLEKTRCGKNRFCENSTCMPESSEVVSTKDIGEYYEWLRCDGVNPAKFILGSSFVDYDETNEV